jgi:hypothetical protein
VQQGKTQLQAGTADLALASGETAIKLNADRWEAYALAVTLGRGVPHGHLPHPTETATPDCLVGSLYRGAVPLERSG